MTDKSSFTAKQVARHLDRRQGRRKLLLWTLLLGAVVAAAMYATCGGGWGLGTGDGTGAGDGDGSARGLLADVDAGPRRCSIFLAPEGITVDGVKRTRAEAVAACKQTTGADVIVAGDTRGGDWDELKAALEDAGIEINRIKPKPSPADAGSGR